MSPRERLLTFTLVAAIVGTALFLSPHHPPASSPPAATRPGAAPTPRPEPLPAQGNTARSRPIEVAPVAREPVAASEPNLALVLPTRSEPIERWKALNYFCRADFNRDDQVDDRDVADFLDAWATSDGPFAEFLDVNHDGWVDSLDVDEFFRAFVNSDCDPSATATYRSTIC